MAKNTVLNILPKMEDIKGIIKFMDGLYVGNNHFNLKDAKKHIKSVILLFDENSKNISLGLDKYKTYLYLDVNFNTIAYTDLDLVFSFFVRTGSLLIISDKLMYSCLYANAICNRYGQKKTLEELQEICTLTEEDDNNYRIIEGWK